MPDPNVEHQELVGQLTVALSAVVRPPAGGKVYPGLNLSDRVDDWKYNYRCPDVAVFLAGNTAQVFESHICGPADFLVEIISPGDKSRDKREFYAELRVRELLVIDRYPWSLELYRLGGNEPGGNEPGGNELGGNELGGNELGGNELGGNELVLAGRSTDQRRAVIASAVLPVSFQLLPAQPRPEIRIAEVAGVRHWIA